MTPDLLMTGPLEATNDAYAIAKLAGITLVQAHRRQHGRAWISCLPTNLYGPGDNYDLETSHVLPALIRRFHEATVDGTPQVTLWGTGTPRREFLHVDDLASACVRLLEVYDDPAPINIGTGAGPHHRRARDASSPTPSATGATSSGTPAGPTAPPASSSTSHPCARSAGSLPSRSPTGSGRRGRSTRRRSFSFTMDHADWDVVRFDTTNSVRLPAHWD
jgi:GDP-L-fucose synthase